MNDPAEMLRLLRRSRGYPDARDSLGSTALCHACGAGMLHAVHILLAAGASADIVNNCGERPLGFLCIYNDGDEDARVAIAKALIACGHPLGRTQAYPEGYDRIAAASGMHKLARLLRSHMRRRKAARV